MGLFEFKFILNYLDFKCEDYENKYGEISPFQVDYKKSFVLEEDNETVNWTPVNRLPHDDEQTSKENDSKCDTVKTVEYVTSLQTISINPLSNLTNKQNISSYNTSDNLIKPIKPN